MSSSRRALAPLVTTLVAGGALRAAVLAFLLIETDDEAAANARSFTSDERAAINAAQTDVANISSLRRAHFDADWKRALDGLTGELATQFGKNKATYKQTLVKGKFDLVAKVLHTALVGRVDDDKVDGYVVLVSFNGYRSDQLVVPTAQQNTLVTVVKKNGKWLAADLKNIGVSGGADGGSGAVPAPTGSAPTPATGGSSSARRAPSTPASSPSPSR